MGAHTRHSWTATFSMRGLLLLVLLSCVAAGFVYLYGQIRLAKETLIASGLKWEPLGIAADEYRVVVQQTLSSDDTAVITARVQTHGRTEVLELIDGIESDGMMTRQSPDTLYPEGLWITVLYDTFDTDQKRFAKVHVEVRRGPGGHGNYIHPQWVEISPDAVIKPQLASGVYRRGQELPLFELDGHRYTLLVK